MKKTIAIAGMGWLGLPLAKHFHVLGFTVTGSVSSQQKAQQLREAGFNTLPLLITEKGVEGHSELLFTGAEYAIVLIPPGFRRNSGANHVAKMRHLLDEIEKTSLKKVILVSSISVYGDAQGKVTEKDLPKPDTENGKQLLQVEQLFFSSEKLKTTIVRFGGLFGGSRQPVRFLAGRENLSNGEAPVNLIHREDCIAILSEIIKQDAFGHIFNAVMPEHPSKKEYYTKRAKEKELEPPHYTEESSEEIFKQVDSVNLDGILNYKFKNSL